MQMSTVVFLLPDRLHPLGSICGPPISSILVLPHPSPLQLHSNSASQTSKIQETKVYRTSEQQKVRRGGQSIVYALVVSLHFGIAAV